MMEESEEGVSQLGSLKYTQAEANAIEEKFSTMLQVHLLFLLYSGIKFSQEEMKD